MERDLDERLLDYAARVIKLVDALPKTIAGRRILPKAAIVSPKRLAPLLDESDQLRAILSKAVATTKENDRST